MAKCIKEVVITGPAGSGKSTLLAGLRQQVSSPERRVIVIPEIATQVIKGGFGDIMQIQKRDPDAYYGIQKMIFTVHDQWRRDAYAQAQRCAEREVLILHDRADMDQLAYISERQFGDMRRETGKTIFDTRDSYDAVMFLRSAARAGQEFYTQANNEARRESAEESLAQEVPTLNAWIGHPHLRIIPSFPNVDDKLRRLLKAVLRLFDGKEIERKFLLEGPRMLPREAGHYVSALVEQLYLKKNKDGKRSRIRQRVVRESRVYYQTFKERIFPVTTLERREDETRISADAYDALSQFQDPTTVDIYKLRDYFVYRDQYFELDNFVKPDTGFSLLELELTDTDDPVDLPPYLPVIKEVTNDPAYTNYEIAKRGRVT